MAVRKSGGPQEWRPAKEAEYIRNTKVYIRNVYRLKQKYIPARTKRYICIYYKYIYKLYIKYIKYVNRGISNNIKSKWTWWLAKMVARKSGGPQEWRPAKVAESL
jgi:hypothetical protein